MKKFLVILTILIGSYSYAQEGVDLEELKAQLNSEDGLGGWVHGAVLDQQMFVFTWRAKGSFFINVSLPMQSESEEVRQKLESFSRHDYVVIKGDFFDNKAPIRHINVTEVLSHQVWDGPSGDHDYSVVPEEILNSTEAIVKVHAIANEGNVLVIEYKDRIFPVFNRDPELVKPLFRNDIIKLKYLSSVKENRPIHLAVNPKVDKPIEVLDRINDGHGEAISLTGSLVMFPKSPQIRYNIFALRIEDENGLRRNYTLTNFENLDLFHAIRNKAQAVWDTQLSSSNYDRNKFINRKIQVTASGVKNNNVANQANPQVIIGDVDNMTFKILD